MKIIAFLILHALIYFIFSFIALEPEPAHWAITTTVFGRIVLVIFEILIIKAVIETDI